MENNKLGYLHAKTWSGREWLLMLCFLLGITVLVYVFTHSIWKGNQYVQLDKKQLQLVYKYLSYDSSLQARDSLASNPNQKRNLFLDHFLRTEMHQKINRQQLNETMSLLAQMKNQDITDYLTDKKFLVNSPFWLTGNKTYLEAFLWSLMGVLVSLVYYVSIANAKSLNTAGTEDSGSFDPAEISGQVAKMFYAPACTIVLVLGYQYLIDANDNMIDISVNNGLIVFAFISGFFSGRVMRFLDRLKELILPFGTATQNTITHAETGKADITVTLDLSETVEKSTDGASISEAGFNAATVTLKPLNGKETIVLVNPTDDQSDDFMGKAVPYGKYVLLAQLAFKKEEDDSIINLSAEEEITINQSSVTKTILLQRMTEEG
ncbi:MAG: hypothetical protein ACOYVG_06530 [Bacteroidota bacterium]